MKNLLAVAGAFLVTLLVLGFPAGPPESLPETPPLDWPESWIPVAQRGSADGARWQTFDCPLDVAAALTQARDHFAAAGLDPLVSENEHGGLLHIHRPAATDSVIMSFAPAPGGSTVTVLTRPPTPIGDTAR